MSLYQCVLLNARGDLRTGEVIESSSLQAAVLQGRRIIAHRPHYDAFEIWEAERLLHAEESARRAVVFGDRPETRTPVSAREMSRAVEPAS